tara:strand:- start:215 stop:1597 length:1383 start_codon:yes stop_codon:yes gene_type:complete
MSRRKSSNSRKRVSRKRKSRRRRYKIEDIYKNQQVDVSNYLFCNVPVSVQNLPPGLEKDNILNSKCSPFVSDFDNTCLMPSITYNGNDQYFYLGNQRLIMTPIKLIGQGSFGEVFKILLRNMKNNNSREFILKKSLHPDPTKESEEWLIRKALHRIKKCTCFIPVLPLNKRMTLMPVADGHLGELAKSRIFFRNDTEVITIYVTLLEIFYCMNKNSIIYVDIKPENILFKIIDNNSIQLLIGDIGSVIQFGDSCYTRTPNYLPLSIRNSHDDWVCTKKNTDKTFYSRISIIQIYAITKTIMQVLNSQWNVTQQYNIQEVARNLDDLKNTLDDTNNLNLIKDSLSPDVFNDFIYQLPRTNKSIIDIFSDSIKKFNPQINNRSPPQPQSLTDEQKLRKYYTEEGDCISKEKVNDFELCDNNMSLAEKRKHFLRQSRNFHPDKNINCPKFSTILFQKLNSSCS